MKNIEAYKKEIMNMQSQEVCHKFVEPVILEKYGTKCNKTECAMCMLLQIVWANEEYGEPKEEPDVDWSAVRVDTPIYVLEDDTQEWIPRHFAGSEDGEIWAWDNGATSWTADGAATLWPQARLAEVNDEK